MRIGFLTHCHQRLAREDAAKPPYAHALFDRGDLSAGRINPPAETIPRRCWTIAFGRFDFTHVAHHRISPFSNGQCAIGRPYREARSGTLSMSWYMSAVQISPRAGRPRSAPPAPRLLATTLIPYAVFHLRLSASQIQYITSNYAARVIAAILHRKSPHEYVNHRKGC